MKVIAFEAKQPHVSLVGAGIGDLAIEQGQESAAGFRIHPVFATPGRPDAEALLVGLAIVGVYRGQIQAPQGIRQVDGPAPDVQVEVECGTSNDRFVIIRSGLQPGDKVLLAEPS